MVAIEDDLWWGHLCPAMANISPLKEAQSKLIALGVDWAEAGRILSAVHAAYVNDVYDASKRFQGEI